LGRTGKTADQPEAFRQGRRAGGVLLQQVKASFDHLVLAEIEGLAEALEPGLAAVIEAHGDGTHRSLRAVIRPYYRLFLAHNATAWPTISCRVKGCAVKAAAIRSRGAASRVLVRGQQISEEAAGQEGAHLLADEAGVNDTFSTDLQGAILQIEWLAAEGIGSQQPDNEDTDVHDAQEFGEMA